MRFYNNLPPIPFDPKMICSPFDPQRFARYKTTSLEIHHQHVLLTEPDLGIPIDLIDPSTYKVPVPRPALHEEDEAILTETATDTKLPKKRPETARPTNVPWLRKHTEFISSEEGAAKKVKKGTEARGGYATQKRQEKEAKESRTTEEIVKAIERGFELAKKPPVHPTDPSLKPVEILPVFPDFRLWPNSYSLVVFDANPSPHKPNPAQPDYEEKLAEEEDLMAHALVKGYAAAAAEDELGNKQQFVTYFTPLKKGDTEPENDKGKGKEKEKGDSDYQSEEQEYEWVREYTYRVDPKIKASYFFAWTSGGVYYNEISSKAVLDKIKSKTTKEVLRRQGRPSRIIRTTRELTAEEERGRETRAETLQPYW
jgi:RNA polymerase II-associated factor 1